MEHNSKTFRKLLDERFKHGITNAGPGEQIYFGINITHNKNLSIETDYDDKINGISEYPMTRVRRKQPYKILNLI